MECDSSEFASRYLKNLCNSKRRCLIRADSALLDNQHSPCSGMLKYLMVNYVCKPPTASKASSKYIYFYFDIVYILHIWSWKFSFLASSTNSNVFCFSSPTSFPSTTVPDKIFGTLTKFYVLPTPTPPAPPPEQCCVVFKHPKKHWSNTKIVLGEGGGWVGLKENKEAEKYNFCSNSNIFCPGL